MKYDERENYHPNRMADAQAEGRTSQSAKTALEEKRSNSMASIKVEGLVEKPLGNNGFILIESIKTPEYVIEKKWKVWQVATIPAFGSTVEVIGEFGAKIAKLEDGTDYITPQGNRYIDLNINKSQVKVLKAPTEASPDVNGDWATAPEVAPF